MYVYDFVAIKLFDFDFDFDFGYWNLFTRGDGEARIQKTTSLSKYDTMMNGIQNEQHQNNIQMPTSANSKILYNKYHCPALM